MKRALSILTDIVLASLIVGLISSQLLGGAAAVKYLFFAESPLAGSLGPCGPCFETIEALPHWSPSAMFDAQMAHVFGAGCIVFGTRLIFGWRAWIGFLCVLAWALPKEYLFDIWIEEDTWAGSNLDMVVYTIAGAKFALITALRDWRAANE